VVFFMCFLLENIRIELGFALGLFAIFGIIRYRTTQIPIREMTYLFLVIGISVINALSNRKVSYAELLFTNVALILVTYLLEKVFLLKHESKKVINFENVELIKPEKREELIRELEERTGLKINRVEIGRIDYLRDSARVFIYYFEQDSWTEVDDDNRSMMDDDDD
jgi:Ca2+/Na+ antiporter